MISSADHINRLIDRLLAATRQPLWREHAMCHEFESELLGVLDDIRQQLVRVHAELYAIRSILAGPQPRRYGADGNVERILPCGHGREVDA
jgi:hypothetical protein